MPKMLLATFGTAQFAGMPRKINNGERKKPPPIPNNPEKKPTSKLKKIMVKKFILKSVGNCPNR